MIDPSEISLFAVALAITGAAGWMVLRLRRGRAIGIVLGGVGLLFLALNGCAVSCTTRCSPFISPGGEYIARTIAVQGGATAPFHANVQVRKKWSPFADTVFDADYSPQEVQLGWIGLHHLLIKYPQQTVRDRFRCLGGSPGVEVTCAPLDNGPAARPSTNTSPPLACTSGF
jgi:hypothetical protein